MIALSGTPGTGKSTVGKILKYPAIDLNELIREKKFYLREEGGTLIADLKKLRRYFSGKREENFILVGHLSHLVNPETAIILRTDPRVLRKRLEKKGFSRKKIEENVLAEILDVILIEANESCKNVYEIDTTEMKPSEVASCIEEIIAGKNLENYSIGKVDWTWQI
jgi:adenylate kinase